MPNTLQYATIFQTGLDKQVVQESTTGWMEENAGQVKYNGGNEIKIPKMAMDGLGSYDRTTGYAPGDVSLEYQTMTFTQDRGRSFTLDAMDVDETNFVATAGALMGEFQRVQVIPEIDAYRYSKIATIAIDGEQNRALAVNKGNILDELLGDLNKMEDVIGNKTVVITMNPILSGMLARGSSEFISKAMLKKGALEVEVQTFNENPIVKAPSNVLKTAIDILDGKTAGQEAGGFKPSADALDINWLITTKDAPIAVSKTDKARVFDPSVNQKADAYKIDYRKYHDVWVPDNKLPCIFVNTSVKA